MAGVYLFLTFTIHAIANSANWYGLDWESSHFLWRLKLTAFYGLQPYSGYQFEYGPVLAYLPILIHALLGPLGATHEFSYYSSHYLFNVAGLFSIAFVLSHAVMPPQRRNAAFIALGLAAFLPNMGLNGVVLRYTAPFFGLVLVHKTACCSRRGQAARVFFSALASIVLCVALSAEIGVTFSAILSIYGVLSMTKRLVMWPVLAAVLVAVALSPALLPSPYFASMAHFSQGANNLPLLPTSPHLVLYLAVMIWMLPKWIAAFLSPVTDRVLICTLGLLALMLAPGALGRCDPYHVLFYGLGTALLGFVYLSSSGKVAFYTYAAVYLLVFCIGLEAINAWVFRLSPRTVAAWVAGAWAGRPVEATDFTPLLKYPQLALPYGSYGYSKAAQQWLWSQRKIAPEYFMGGMGIYTDTQVRERLNDLGRFHYALILGSFQNLHRHDSHEPCVADSWYLRKALLYPGHLPCVRPALDPDSEISRFLEREYQVAERVGDYLVLEKRQPG
jgi:hypothetical protein